MATLTSIGRVRWPARLGSSVACGPRRSRGGVSLTGAGRMDVHVTLGDRDGNAVLSEQLQDFQQDLAGDVADAVLNVLDPEPDFELDAMVGEAEHERERLWARATRVSIPPRLHHDGQRLAAHRS